tara:strand:- start:807 stop:1127 length:321 start_codon:yes stop_codon:yes gene_type:complete
MKSLKFANSLIQLILDGKKINTWRINDDKNLTENDILSLINIKREEFAKAIIISVKETTFEEVDQCDKEGHEKFSSDEEMYRTYSKYYNINVTPQTKLKIIGFKLK